MNTILIADATQENVQLLSETLAAFCTVRTASSGQEALAAMSASPRPDLALLGASMTSLDGFEVMRRMKGDAAIAGIGVMLVNAPDRPEDEEMGLSLGAVDYLTNPIHPVVLAARVKTQLQARAERGALASRIMALEAQVRRQIHEGILLQGIAGNIIGSLAEASNPGTGKHLRRIQGYVAAMCTDLASHPRFAETLTPQNIQLLIKAAPMYDIGMLLVPSEILRKQTPLTQQEWETIRDHCRLGGAAITRALTATSQPLPFLKIARDCALSHHERWNGSGYPQGLTTDTIPIAARIVGLADSFDAMIGKRPFQEAFDIIFQGGGTLFDPDVVDAFLAQFDAIQAAADREADTPEETQARMARLGRLG